MPQLPDLDELTRLASGHMAFPEKPYQVQYPHHLNDNQLKDGFRTSKVS
jgi:hypothetical protein